MEERGILTKIEKKAKRKIRDSVFTKLFKDKTNILKLYRMLHPKDKEVDTNDIDIVTIETVLVDGLYNDLGFSVKGKDNKVKKIILVESQTKWDINMAERMSSYAQETRERYWLGSEQKYHQRNKMHTPVFEHYVVYTGCKRYNKEYMMLHEDGQTPKNSMNLGVKILTKEDNTICGQYISFCKVYTNQLKENRDDKNKILNETIRICMKNNYLRDFFEKNLWEVMNVMGMFSNQAEAVENYGQRKKAEGRAEGEKKGRAEGKAEGRAEGKAEGRAEGRTEGIEDAIKAFFTRDKKNMEIIAENMGISVKEYVDICAKSMNIKKELFIEICARNLNMSVEDYKKEYDID